MIFVSEFSLVLGVKNSILCTLYIFMRQDGHDGMVVRQHNNQESHTDGIIVRHGQVNAVKARIT